MSQEEIERYEQDRARRYGRGIEIDEWEAA
jgi:hypothetical protein